MLDMLFSLLFLPKLLLTQCGAFNQDTSVAVLVCLIMKTISAKDLGGIDQRELDRMQNRMGRSLVQIPRCSGWVKVSTFALEIAAVEHELGLEHSFQFKSQIGQCPRGQ